ncbi:DNA-binding domain-containing protein [Nostoc commune]|uniref:DNA-binding domain-containing protein n=1 Tax=Nostoc commune TaxID=1178 RepID=UPI0018C6A29C|nr:DNA-binding domain-containing protein [Nostoc commune]MBG1260616.1 DNA-binding domain-containing protein [Nostoc commune BAE]
MTKPQIAVRIPKSLFVKLSNHVERNRTSKTEIVVSALANYLGCLEEVPLIQRIAEIEERLKLLETTLTRHLQKLNS